jgi:hypothetical protein
MKARDLTPESRDVRRTPTVLGRSAEVLEADSRAWGMSMSVALVVGAAPVVAGLLVVATMRSVPLFDWLTRENSLLESSQFIALVAATLALLSVGVHFVRRRRAALGLAYLLLALAAFFIAGEEISWGQTIFEWEGSDWLTRGNYQAETNLHTGVAHGPTVYGFILLGAYGTLVPLAPRRLSEHRTPVSYLLVPPLVLVPTFFISFAYRLIRTAFNPEERLPRYALQIVEFAEFAESSLYFAVLVIAILTWRLYVPRSARFRPSRAQG